MKRPVRRNSRIVKHYNKNETIKDTEKQSILDSTLIIGFLTVIGYYVAFSYEKGYKSYFHITDVFLDDVTLVNVLIAITAISGVWISFYPIFNFLMKQTNGNFNYFFRKVLLVPILIVLLSFIILPREKSSYIIILIVVGIILFINTIPPLLFTKEKGYINKLKSYNNDFEMKRSFSDTIQFLINRDKKSFLILVICLIFVSSNLAELIGMGDASKEEDYIVIKKPTPHVVIGNHKDKLIIAPIDLETQTVTPKFQIIESKSDLKDPLVFETMDFENGLKVKEPEDVKEEPQKKEQLKKDSKK